MEDPTGLDSYPFSDHVCRLEVGSSSLTAGNWPASIALDYERWWPTLIPARIGDGRNPNVWRDVGAVQPEAVDTIEALMETAK
ncbi:MAG: hypothetical protein ACJ78Q_12170 [Chloroflexia bacterium]